MMAGQFGGEATAGSPYDFHPIGWVENEIDSVHASVDSFMGTESRIRIKPEFSEGLNRLEDYPRIAVVFVFHRSSGYSLMVHPRGDTSRPMRGVFATHSPRRPNPIGVSVVELLGIDRNVVRVKGLDAINGTPVLDIKPLHSRWTGEEPGGR